ncbi:MAG TPA: hypothetical protein VGK48_05225 [Terriglobia bacterium]|jgi:hypothetical protein
MDILASPGDMDFFVRASPDNADRMISVLSAFGFSDIADLKSTLIQSDKVIQLGRPPH